MAAIKVVQIGLGPLGIKTAQYIANRAGIETVGAVDLNPDLIGRDLGDLCGLGTMGIKISGSIGQCLDETKPDAAILTTVSDMERITPQIEEIVSHGVPVVSTCEELSYPLQTTPELAARVDQAAKKNQVAVLGTGINPGFLMDSLPTFLTGVCQDVKTVKVSRIQDAAFRRVPFQKKIGAGLDLEAFDKKKADGSLRHVGLTESIHLIAGCLGWTLTKTEDIISPVVTEKEIVTEAMTIPAGYAAGVMQVGRGFVGDEEKITLLFRAAVGEPGSHDTVEIEGTPNIKSTIEGGVNGDVATCAITINSVNQIIKANPGLRTMADISMVSFFS